MLLRIDKKRWVNFDNINFVIIDKNILRIYLNNDGLSAEVDKEYLTQFCSTLNLPFSEILSMLGDQDDQSDQRNESKEK
ncbi:MAG: hypothetical protein R3321_06865 [Nitrososphaeraceae archaeon]|nr:hypothetical protein [Nitrososphaeraceae archaeon]